MGDAFFAILPAKKEMEANRWQLKQKRSDAVEVTPLCKESDDDET